MKIAKTALGAVCLSLCASAAVAETLEFTPGDVGGVWYTSAAGIAELLQEKIPGLTVKTVPGGGVANPVKVNSGQSQLGFVQSIFATAAVRGAEPFQDKKQPNLRLVLQGLALNYIHHLREKGDAADLAQSVQRKGSIGLARSGSTDEFTFRFALKFYNSSYDALRSAGTRLVQADYGDLAAAFKDRHVDSVFVLLGLPGAAIQDAAQGRNAELAPLPPALIDHLATTYGYTRGTIPANTYAFQVADVPTVITSTSLYTSASVADATVHAVIKTVCDNAARLATVHRSMAGFACKPGVEGDGSVKLHPGAERYLRESGVLKGS